MKTVTFTEFRKRASGFVTEVERGETIILLRRGKPVAEVVPFSDSRAGAPAWKRPGLRLRLKGSDLSSAILSDREARG